MFVFEELQDSNSVEWDFKEFIVVPGNTLNVVNGSLSATGGRLYNSQHVDPDISVQPKSKW